jgi:protoheme IX farnesyltransferase
VALLEAAVPRQSGASSAAFLVLLAGLAGLSLGVAAALPGRPLGLGIAAALQIVLLVPLRSRLSGPVPGRTLVIRLGQAALWFGALGVGTQAHAAAPPLAAAIALAAVWTWRQDWAHHRTQPAFAVLSSSRSALALAWTVMLLSGRGEGLLAATTALAWAASFAVLVLQLSPQPAARGIDSAPKAAPAWRDYLALTKPVIVILLLVTTLAGMVVGAGRWPGPELVLWTMLGGALSAGGASALNQYIDRDLDGRMQRTQRRPFPSGRIGEAQGLAFAIVLCLAGFYTLALAVNVLSALLSLAGMLYYVVLYSLVLKQSTTQNIVVGGGAGAIPPLVGWAAATGSLSMAAFFLFAVIFFWTPPHFWALALLRRKDYARAGVPMLPVVESERSTAWQILLYSVQLVALTMLLPLAGVGGAGFALAAAASGLGFIAFAWRLWRLGGNRPAYSLYRYSSMYLALIFAAMVVDTLLRA